MSFMPGAIKIRGFDMETCLQKCFRLKEAGKEKIGITP